MICCRKLKLSEPAINCMIKYGIFKRTNAVLLALMLQKKPLLHFVQKLASNDNFDIVFRQVENLEAHIFKISVSICLAKHSPHFVIESLHGGIG